jgi:FtsP/CotA-like multicopper oxidase with cupredoxin domain
MGQMQYCFMDEQGHRSPTLRVRPGDLVALKLKNELSLPSSSTHTSMYSNCASAAMTTLDTNLHFRGLSVPPSCHADDSLHTSIRPAKTFVYRFRIPTNQSPGLYWYHPHPHGHSEEQVLGGASGALIVDGIASANPIVAGLPERVFVIRDQKLVTAPPATLGRDVNRPAKDLSVNFIPVPYPEYPVPAINVRPRTREFWRVLNASADTYLNLAVLFNGEWQKSGLAISNGSWQSFVLIALDGVSISEGNSSLEKMIQKTEITIPPGGRAEFVLETPAAGIKAELFTSGVGTNPPQDEDAPATLHSGLIADDDDNTPPRPLVRIVATDSAVEPSPLTEAPLRPNTDHIQSIAAIPAVRQRELYFSEKVMDAKHPTTSTVFYLTEEGHTPKAFDPSALDPDIVVHHGDVEDWTIENRSQESHAFHIHQLHFLLLERNGELGENYFLDTVDVPYWDGISPRFPSVKLRMDFRDPNIVGTFPYHRHILQHADGGMMGTIQVLPKLQNKMRIDAEQSIAAYH